MVKTLIIFILISVFCFLFLFGLIIGEIFVLNNEHTKFGKWWRKYICSPDPNENE
jgi:hypothetical protein